MSPFVGIQMGSHSILDEGVEHVLDTVQETAGVNALLLYSHEYGRFINERRPDQIADHGVPRRTEQRTMTRVFVRRSDERFYRGTSLRHETRPEEEYSDRDVFDEVMPHARNRGIEVHARILERHAGSRIANWSRIAEIEHDGRPSTNGCWRNPEYANFWLGTVEDLFAHYELDGFHFGCERTGPLTGVSMWGGGGTCFCPYCEAAGRARGLDPRRARQGLTELRALVHGARRQHESMLLQVMRLLGRYPEILGWDRLWHDGREDVYRRIHGIVRDVAPRAKLGFHLWQGITSWDLWGRAAFDHGEMARWCDYLKPCAYQDVGGARITAYTRNDHGRWWLQGMPQADIYRLLGHVIGLDMDEEPALEHLAQEGFSDAYVRRLTAQSVEAAAGGCAVYTGIGVDVLQALDAERAAASAAAATRAAFAGGAEGIILCREYDEMRLTTLRAVGDALAERPAPVGAP